MTAQDERTTAALDELATAAESLLRTAIEASLEDSYIRLSRVRAVLDRLEEVRTRVSRYRRSTDAYATQCEFADRTGYARAASSGSSRASAAERDAAYLLRSLDAARTAVRARVLADEARSVERYVSNVYRAVSDHRLEALTLLRAGLRISDEEYHVLQGSEK